MTRLTTVHTLGNVLVTGGTGFLGTELMQQMLDAREAANVVCLLRDSVPHSRFHADAVAARVTIVNGDIRDQALVNRTLNEYEIQTVMHLAAQTLVGQANTHPSETLDVNVRGTWTVLEGVRQNAHTVRATIVASSDKAYGDLTGAQYEETFPLAGQHPYDVSKSCADLIAHAYAKTYRMNVCMTRCGNLFGPGDINDSNLFPSVIGALLRGEAPIIRSDGRSIRDFLYVADGAAAYRLLAHRMADGALAGEAFNFSCERSMTVLDVTQAIIREMGLTVEPRILGSARNEIPAQALSSAKARRVLGWTPSVDFDEGVRRTVQWYRARFDGVAETEAR